MKVNQTNLKAFIKKWTDKGREDEDDRSYWIDLFQDVFEQSGVTDRLSFQKKVTGRDGNTKRIDVYIPETKVIIEQKSLNVALDKPQAGHDGMTPFEQARMYNDGLPFSERARWIVTSNFAEIWIYDMDKRKPEEEIIKVSLSELDKQYPTLQFLFDNRVEEIRKELKVSQEAGDRIGNIYDALLAQIPGEPTEAEYKSLNLFCVRLVFCYYAEDAGLFGKYQFHDYMKGFNTRHLRNGLKDLFRILDTKESERDRNDEPELLAFPYVNGGLFADRNIVIPQIDENTHKIMVETSDFNWSSISPTIFGAVFESTLNQETRRKGGMHYTSIENIHKVIDPLFLDNLKEEYRKISEMKKPNAKIQKLKEYQNKLSSLKFFDPACGSGNFLTETYLSLRRLENDVIKDITELDRSINPNQIALGDFGPGESIIKVNLSQFFGIEINDFAVSVAKTALWIAENQMLKETEEIVYQQMEFLPLKSYVNIVENNALRIDWESVVSSSECSYIMGNPPFVGSSNKETANQQKEDRCLVFGNDKAGKLDYVACWYKKASDYIEGTNIKCAFVSTNSITQGEQVIPLWKPLRENGININFAYRSFGWDSEAAKKAQVHCVIIGFSKTDEPDKFICENGVKKYVAHINGYLINFDDFYITSRGQPQDGFPTLTQGSKPWDGGGLLLSEEEKDDMIKKYPMTQRFIREYIGAQEFLNNTKRYCLWLKDVPPQDYRNIPEIRDRLTKVAQTRIKTQTKAVQLQASTPFLFSQIRQPDSDYILIPETSSETRKYIPIGYMRKDVIASNSTLTGKNTTLFHFGILESSVHMGWMRVIAGRMDNRYRYSPSVYNNFPWPTPTDDQKTKIEQTAQAILDARDLYPDSSLADLYDPLTMPIELRKAHEANDKAVMKAYGFDPSMEEPEIVAELMKMYQKLTKGSK